jgi:hypothetical protein
VAQSLKLVVVGHGLKLQLRPQPALNRVVCFS